MAAVREIYFLRTCLREIQKNYDTSIKVLSIIAKYSIVTEQLLLQNTLIAIYKSIPYLSRTVICNAQYVSTVQYCVIMCTAAEHTCSTRV
jgi:hypothetical protein